MTAAMTTPQNPKKTAIPDGPDGNYLIDVYARTRTRTRDAYNVRSVISVSRPAETPAKLPKTFATAEDRFRTPVTQMMGGFR
jgi:hypothetical protein